MDRRSPTRKRRERRRMRETDAVTGLYIYVFLDGGTDYIPARILFENPQPRDKEQFYLSTTDKYK